MNPSPNSMDGSHPLEASSPSSDCTGGGNITGSAYRAWFLAGNAVALTFILLNIHLITGTCVIKWDAWNVFWPWFTYLADSLAVNRFPLWAPGANCGFPIFAEPQAAGFYPVACVSALVFGGGHMVYQAYWLVHWFLGTIGFFFLMSRLGITPAGAFAATITYCFSGYYIGHAEHTPSIVFVAFVPWVLLLVDFAHDRSLWFSFPAGVLLGLAGLGGYPGLIIFFGPLLLLWCLLKFRDLKKTAIIALLTFVTAAAILSPTYLSFLTEGRGYTDRSGPLSVKEACGLNRFTWGALVAMLAPSMTMAYPHLFGAAVPHIPMLNPYMGIFGALSIVLAMFDERTRNRWRWLLIFVLIGFLLSLGSAGGLRVVAHYLFPPLQWVRHMGMIRIFWMFGCCILVGVVFDRLVTGNATRTRYLTGVSLAVLAVFFYLSVTILLWAWLEGDHIIRHGFIHTYQRANSFSAALGCVVGPLILIAAFAGAMAALRFSVSRTLVAGALLLLIVADAAIHQYTNRQTVCWNGQALTTAQRLDGARPKEWSHREVSMGQRKIGPPFFNLWAFDGNSYVRTNLATTSRVYDSLVGGTWPPFKETGFLEVLLHAPRFWLTPHVRCVDDKNPEVLAALKSSKPDGPVPVYVHSNGCVDSFDSDSWTVPGSFGSVTVLTYKPEHVVLRVNAPKDCRLFATERFAGSWKAEVDGKRVEVEKANFCFRAIPVPRGDHIVEMRYSPWLYKPLLILSWGLAALILLAWVGTAVHNRIKRRPNKVVGEAP